MMRTQTIFIDGNELARFDFADKTCPDNIERSGFTCNNPTCLELSNDERSDPMSISRCIKGVLIHKDE